MKTKIISQILLTLMLAACSTQHEATTTAMRDTAATTATASSQVSAPSPALSVPSFSAIGGTH
jgi:hypothetical protein